MATNPDEAIRGVGDMRVVEGEANWADWIEPGDAIKGQGNLRVTVPESEIRPGNPEQPQTKPVTESNGTPQGAALPAAPEGTGSTTALYHYTSADPQAILENGLLPGTSGSGNVYLTPDGDLSPIQAHIELGMSPGRGFPQHLFEVDAQGLAEHLGHELPAPTRVTGWPGGGAGGGWEVPINAPIPPWLLRLVR